MTLVLPYASPSWTRALVSWTILCLVAGIALGRYTHQQQQSQPSPDEKDDDDDDNNNTNKSNKNKNNKLQYRDDSSHRRRRTLLQDEINANKGNITLQPVGVVRSVYSLCVGTPRQGLLAPAARGRVEFTVATADDDDACDGLEAYSHLWIIFLFHLNTTGKKKQKSKIAPPAAGGRRVGVWSTRSPHRPSPIGLSLVRLDGVRTERRRYNGGGKPQFVTILDISGLDLVDGTPVLDIKPYVPVYDNAIGSDKDVVVRLPDWVAQGLQTTRSVTWTAAAADEFLQVLQQHDLQFYDAKLEVETVQQAIEQVLSIDVRSVYQTNKARQGDFQAERSHRIQTNAVTKNKRSTNTTGNDDNSEQQQQQQQQRTCTQQLDNLLIHYTVQAAAQAQRPESAGSGAEDVVHITSIQYLPPLATKT